MGSAAWRATDKRATRRSMLDLGGGAVDGGLVAVVEAGEDGRGG